MMSTFYISPTGSDTTGDGSLFKPWLTNLHAADYPLGRYVKPADTVYFRGGVHADNDLFFWPGGVSKAQRTTWLNYPGERPVFAPALGFDIADNYVDVSGLWVKGTTNDPNTAMVLDGRQYPFPNDGETFYKSIRNCVFWGLPYTAIGHQDYTFFQGCKWWGCGSVSPPSPSEFTSTLYFRGEDGQGATHQGNHGLIDNCIFLNAAADYLIAAKRVFNNLIVTRSFLGNSPLGIIHAGLGAGIAAAGALFANNIFWKGASGGNVALDPQSSFARMWNNIFDRSATAIYLEAQANQIAGNNAFDPATTAIGYPASTDVHYDSAGTMGGYLSKTRTQIDSAIAALATSFGASLATIATDLTIDTNFALLAGLQAVSGGGFNNAGHRWCKEQPAVVDIGLNVSVPVSEDDFWAAFYTLGLPSRDAGGIVMYPIYPPLNIPPEPYNW